MLTFKRNKCLIMFLEIDIKESRNLNSGVKVKFKLRDSFIRIVLKLFYYFGIN